jgi:hypothetical protein
MKPSYADIRNRIEAAPLWFDEHGVPRYDPFTPRMGSIYARDVALIEIQCQACDFTALVSIGFDAWEMTPSYTRPTTGNIGSYHYGDPPIHGCVGDTMNVESRRIIEFWSCNTFIEWHRLAEHEVEIEPIEPEDSGDVE